MNIGWIGLGSIGTEMVKRLLGAGHAVTVYARGQGLSEVRAAGARTDFDYQALAAGCELLVVCVFNDAQMREVLFDRGALAALRPGSILAFHTTGSPELAIELGERAPPGVGVLEATFSGGPADIAAGRLTVIAGGAAADLDRARPALEAYAGVIHHVGPLGCGQKVKLLNNLVFATNLMNAAEAMRIAQGWGLEAATVAQVIQTCSGASYTMNMFASPRPVETALQAARRYIAKDVAVVAETARESGLDVSPFAATIGYWKAD